MLTQGEKEEDIQEFISSDRAAARVKKTTGGTQKEAKAHTSSANGSHSGEGKQKAHPGKARNVVQRNQQSYPGASQFSRLQIHCGF